MTIEVIEKAKRTFDDGMLEMLKVAEKFCVRLHGDRFTASHGGCGPYLPEVELFLKLSEKYHSLRDRTPKWREDFDLEKDPKETE